MAEGLLEVVTTLSGVITLLLTRVTPIRPFEGIKSEDLSPVISTY